MKARIIFIVYLISYFISACSVSGFEQKADPTVEQIASTYQGVNAYDDVRNKNFQVKGAEFGEALITTFWFNGTTSWVEEDAAIAEKILQLGMNPGLGVRDLHAQGITGKGVTVAIIDQHLLLDHPEYKGKIVEYMDVGTNMSSLQGSMHAPGVTSLLVGENIGTAPDAEVYFAAAPSWNADAQYFADALNWIVDENEKLPDENKIRVVSVSAAPSGEGSPFTENNDAWDAAYQRATDADILVLDCTKDHGIVAPCTYDLYDVDNVAKCIPGWPGIENSSFGEGYIHIPTSRRSTAEEYIEGKYAYQFSGRGGLSWSVPYLTGVLAMGWQVNPQLSNEEMLDILFDSAYQTESGEKVINPPAFIEAVQDTVD